MLATSPAARLPRRDTGRQDRGAGGSEAMAEAAGQGEGAGQPGRRLVVFADGTGNAYGTHESNVWRLYQALDQSAPDQIARYIKGVGTSGFRPLAALDGATGFGVPSNVRELYRFLCWNWQPGDEIFAFGFSRGAFTIRTLAGMIASQGLVPTAIEGEPVTPAEMERNAMAAWRAYRASSQSFGQRWPTITITRALRDAVLWAWHGLWRHRRYAAVTAATQAQGRDAVTIRFLGLFDTVEAYGVPIDGLRAAIDRTIWPISFHNRTPSEKVLAARHALALDEERASFQPVQFDVPEARLPAIQELWFAGVHSDVGGGYPDDALAFLPLAWIASEAEAAGLRFAEGALERFGAAGSFVPPIHDSRAGLAVLYRYAPRDIAGRAGEGATRPARVHNSVVEKIARGGDAYAPVTLGGEVQARLPSGALVPVRPARPERLVVPEDAATLAALEHIGVPPPEALARAADYAWWRQLAYVALVLVLAGIASLPWTAGSLPAAPGFLHAWRDWLSVSFGGLIALLRGVLPGFLAPWLELPPRYPFVTLGAAGLAFGAWWWGSELARRVKTASRIAWLPRAREAARQRLAQAGAAPRHGTWLRLARAIRTSWLPGAISRVVSRVVLPVALLAALLLGATQAVATFQAAGDALCAGSAAPRPVQGREAAASEFAANTPCWASGLALRQGERYRIVIEEIEPFFDRGARAGLGGFSSAEAPWRFGVALRRWWGAAWFRVIARVDNGIGAEAPLLPLDATPPRALPPARVPPEPQGIGAFEPMPAAWRAEAARRDVVPPPLTRLVSEFTAAKNGELFLYVNDVMPGIPFYGPVRAFYANNAGTARVTVERLPR